MPDWLLCLSERSLPGEHSRVGIAGMALLPVLSHGRHNLLPHPDEVLHGVEGQLDVISLQAHQVIWLQSEETMQEKNDFNGGRK